MTHDCPAGQGPVRASDRRGWLLSGVLSGLLMVSLLIVPVDGVSAASLNPAPAAWDALSAGTTLAVVRATGASLYDDAGQPVRDLPSGAAFKVSGRTADMRWFYGVTRDGATGWVSAASVLIFGVSNVPPREGFIAPTGLATEDTEETESTSESALRPLWILQQSLRGNPLRPLSPLWQTVCPRSSRPDRSGSTCDPARARTIPSSVGLPTARR